MEVQHAELLLSTGNDKVTTGARRVCEKRTYRPHLAEVDLHMVQDQHKHQTLAFFFFLFTCE